MATPPSSPSLLRRWVGARRTPRQPEPADMGTAFGMEQWLGDLEAEEGVPAAGEGPERAAWLRRWMAGGTPG